MQLHHLHKKKQEMNRLMINSFFLPVIQIILNLSSLYSIPCLEEGKKEKERNVSKQKCYTVFMDKWSSPRSQNLKACI